MTRLITRLYPRAWRERYGDELSELIDETGLSPRDAIDVVRGAAREWTSQARLAIAGGGSMVIGPAWRHPQVWALVAFLVLAPTALLVVFSILAYQLGQTWLIGFMDPVMRWMQSARIVDLIFVVSPAIALLIAAAPLLRVELRKNEVGGTALIEVRMKLLNVAIGLLALFIGVLLVGHILAESVLQVGS
ncbi:MAG TPA: hypothetical protein VM284_06730 [Candidatus Limnocylindria bacterium]|nr:hypothetical protein [Candidatus Limnocylindria bacterium]